MLKAVILGGGRGMRLRPLTDDVPKPMVNIGSKPFLQYQIELLKKNQITSFILCVGYLKKKIIDYFGDGSAFGVKIDYSVEEDFLGTGGALKKAQGFLAEEFILLYGDSYLPIDYVELAKFCSSHPHIGVVVCYDNKLKIARSNLYVDKTGLITKYDKRAPDKNMNYVEAGVIVLKKKILDFIPKDKTISLEEEIFPVLIKEGQLLGYPTSQRYYDMGAPEGLAKIRGLLT